MFHFLSPKTKAKTHDLNGVLWPMFKYELHGRVCRLPSRSGDTVEVVVRVCPEGYSLLPSRPELAADIPLGLTRTQLLQYATNTFSQEPGHTRPHILRLQENEWRPLPVSFYDKLFEDAQQLKEVPSDVLLEESTFYGPYGLGGLEGVDRALAVTVASTQPASSSRRQGGGGGPSAASAQALTSSTATPTASDVAADAVTAGGSSQEGAAAAAAGSAQQPRARSLSPLDLTRSDPSGTSPDAPTPGLEDEPEEFRSQEVALKTASNGLEYPEKWVLGEKDITLEKYENMTYASDDEWEVERVVDERQKGGVTEYLIKWEGFELAAGTSRSGGDWQTLNPGDAIEEWEREGRALMQRIRGPGWPQEMRPGRRGQRWKVNRVLNLVPDKAEQREVAESSKSPRKVARRAGRSTSDVGGPRGKPATRPAGRKRKR